ncbi:MAG: DMT family transporter [Betaproteobacteria bacterium]|nr:MAG: DMT family transporter [Betaproteobacteria bacterium]
MQASDSGAAKLWLQAMPGLFVLLWSTGFVSAKYGLPYAEPLTFLLLRFALVVALMLPLALVMRVAWPRSLTQIGHVALVGVLMQGGYLSGVFCSINLGMSAGVSALIVGVQPILTAFASAPLFGERLRARQWTGLVLGFGGVLLVVLGRSALSGITPATLALSVLALLSITAGTLYQKRFCGAVDLRAGSVIQFCAAGLVLLPLALTFETMQVRWTGEFIFTIAWLVLVLSMGAISLLYILIRRGAATRVASLFYLVPPSTALMAYAMFGETLSLMAMAGMVLAAIGVALVVYRRQ